MIDGATATVVGTINLPDHATLVAVNPATNRLYTNPAGHVRVIDALTSDTIADVTIQHGNPSAASGDGGAAIRMHSTLLVLERCTVTDSITDGRGGGGYTSPAR